MSEEIALTIIGAGAVGCAVACEISRDFSGDIAVVEKNSRITGENQSSRNSGVIHAGIYYPGDIGPFKASMCVEGNSLLYEFCKNNNVLHKKTGKLVVATEEPELEYLEDVRRIALENGVPDIRIIGKDEIKKFEPNVSGIAALYVPSSGIIEPTRLVEKLHAIAQSQGVMFLIENRAANIVPCGDKFSLTTVSRGAAEEFVTGIVINCGGLFSDEIAKFVNPDSPYEMDPVKGDSAKFYCSKRENIFMNGMNVYPVPFGYYPDGERAIVDFTTFKELFAQNRVSKSVGVHLSPAFDLKGGRYETGTTVTLGPAYSRPSNKEDYQPGRNTEYFHELVKPFFPNLMLQDISLHQTGIRAKLKNHYDFVIEGDRKYPNFINLIGIDSPGLTSCLAIAKYVAKMVKALK